MSGNSFGHTFRITTFGESHGPFIGVVIDGCPSKISISEKDIQKEVDKRKPNLPGISTDRKEEDKVRVISGIFGGKTLGTPIAVIVENKNTRSQDYKGLEKKFRKGHADEAYQLKYGIRDHRGGGRSSGRETVARVIAGAVAKKILPKTLKIKGEILQIGHIKGNLKKMLEYAKDLKDNSCGGIVEIKVKNVPVGLGEPVFDKLDATLAKALMSIGAVKGVEVGAGFATAEMLGSENIKEGKNHAGGIFGGISDGSEISLRIAIKPTPSIKIKGRHDKCIVPRIVPVAESMVAITLADHFLRYNKGN
jgi:chorismate synthase